jgi:hypothetical protein
LYSLSGLFVCLPLRQKSINPRSTTGPRQTEAIFNGDRRFHFSHQFARYSMMQDPRLYGEDGNWKGDTYSDIVVE